MQDSGSPHSTPPLSFPFFRTMHRCTNPGEKGGGGGGGGVGGVGVSHSFMA